LQHQLCGKLPSIAPFGGVMATFNQLLQLRAAVRESGDILRDLQNKNASKRDVVSALVEHRLRMRQLERKEVSPRLDRDKLRNLLNRRFIYDDSIDVNGGEIELSGVGAFGKILHNKLIAEWRNHFIDEEMLEVHSSLTPEPDRRETWINSLIGW
ncbi:hypothetical protein PENTCL1PPCAC_10655, partial [Pristionchus entomophagus]